MGRSTPPVSPVSVLVHSLQYRQGRDGGLIKERKVVVKLTDFGLGTMDAESADMDCGSAPYMSFGECQSCKI